MANSYNIENLSNFVSSHGTELIGKAVLGGKTSRMATVQTGVKSSAPINLINTTVTFGNGGACGWNEAGSTSLSNRSLVCGAIKVNMAICDKTLLGKWGEWEVKVAAGQKELPFEEEFSKNLAENISKALDYVVWQGDTTSGDANLSRFDGLIKNIGTGIASTIAAGSTYIAAVQQVVKAMPSAIMSREDLVIFCSPEFLASYRMALVNANLYHYEANPKNDEQLIPGTNIRLVAVVGLTGISKLFGASLANVFYGCDLQGDEEKFDIWYSQDNREFRVAVEFVAGANVAYPAEVVVGTYTTLA